MSFRISMGVIGLGLAYLQSENWRVRDKIDSDLAIGSSALGASGVLGILLGRSLEERVRPKRSSPCVAGPRPGSLVIDLVEVRPGRWGPASLCGIPRGVVKSVYGLAASAIVLSLLLLADSVFQSDSNLA